MRVKHTHALFSDQIELTESNEDVFDESSLACKRLGPDNNNSKDQSARIQRVCDHHRPCFNMSGLVFFLRSGIHRTEVAWPNTEISLRDLRLEAVKFINKYVSS